MKNLCCSFGHREVYRDISEKLCTALEELIVENNVKIFMTGGMGEFDNKFTEAVNALKKKHPEVRLILVIPYFIEAINKNKEYYEKTYDEIIIPETLEGVYPKAAIEKRNRWMAEQCDRIVVFLNRKFGGAYKAVKYAKRLNKEIIEI